MVANSVGLINRIFLGDENIWVLASCHDLLYINSVQLFIHFIHYLFDTSRVYAIVKIRLKQN